MPFRDGNLVKCEIYGEVIVNSHLSGLPDLTLSFANPSILNDVRFHPCVRFRPWESHQVLSFVPPDGQFKLMNYRSGLQCQSLIIPCRDPEYIIHLGFLFCPLAASSLLITQWICLLNRIKRLKNIPVYVKPQLISDAGTCRATVLVGIRNDPGKTIDNIAVRFQLPPCVASADLTSNHGTVNILSNKVSCHSFKLLYDLYHRWQFYQDLSSWFYFILF